MVKEPLRTSFTAISIGQNSMLRFFGAAVIYICFCIYLYHPYFSRFERAEFLFGLNSLLGALGCYVLSKRWVKSFSASVLGAAIYGFGPYFLGLALYHSAVGFVAAMVPWLLLPAVYGPRGKLKWIRGPLSLSAFLVIFLSIKGFEYLHLFALPVQLRLEAKDMAGLFVPLLSAGKVSCMIGFYHVAIVPLIIGGAMFIAARRLGAIIIFFISIVLACCGSITGVSAIIWLAIPFVLFSVIISEGIQGLILAGAGDRKWILGAGIAAAIVCVVTLFLATEYFQSFLGLGDGQGRIFVQTAKMYLLGVLTAGVIYFFARANMRFLWIRILIVCAAIGLDIFLSAGFVVDKIF
jgi:hypothetical protein